MLQLAEMARLGVQPDSIAATALLDACARNGKMDMATSVFEELFDGLLAPDDVTFAVLVRGYGEADPPQWAAISGLLGMMDTRFQLKPSTAVYNSLLDICARTKDDERGYEVIERMHRSAVETDARTLDAVRNRKSLRSHLKRVFGEGLATAGSRH